MRKLLSAVAVIWIAASPGVHAIELGVPPRAPAPATTQGRRVAPLAVESLSVNISSREAVRNFYNTHYVASAFVPIGWSGNVATCNEGSTTLAFRDAVARRINYYRAMAGVPAGISLDADYNGLCQEAALMMSRNDDLSHAPPGSWACYTAAGAEGARNSNLALGLTGAAAMDLYMEDPGDGNFFVGHRRWLLYPQTQTMGTGDIPDASAYVAANALWAIDANAGGPRPDTRNLFVAWPPAGFVPYQVVWPRWSLSHPGADFSAATVQMSSGGVNIPVTLYRRVGGYGEDTLVWCPDSLAQQTDDVYEWPRPAVDTSYVVTVANISIDGVLQEYRYTVRVMDPAVAGGLWSDAIPLGNGWYWSNWFGYIFPTGDAWLFHWQHGWLYAFGTQASDVWFWDHEMRTYWWTSNSYYPYLFRASDAQWLWYQRDSDNPRVFLNMQTGQWISQ